MRVAQGRTSWVNRISSPPARSTPCVGPRARIRNDRTTRTGPAPRTGIVRSTPSGVPLSSEACGVTWRRSRPSSHSPPSWSVTVPVPVPLDDLDHDVVVRLLMDDPLVVQGQAPRGLTACAELNGPDPSAPSIAATRTSASSTHPTDSAVHSRLVKVSTESTWSGPPAG